MNILVPTMLAATLAATLSPRCPGQRQFDELQRSGWPAANQLAWATAAGDVDGDQDVDILFATPGFATLGVRQIRLYENDGLGAFADVSESRMPLYSGFIRDPTAMELADLDRDGDLDLVVALARSGFAWLYLNDGSGTFLDASTTHLPATAGSFRDLALGDLDGDGDLDLVLGGSGPNQLLLNDGTGRFLAATASRMPALDADTQAVALADLDADGDLDLVCGNGVFAPQQNHVLLNDGSGTFTDATAALAPVVLDTTFSVAIADADGDGDLDVAFGNGKDERDRGAQDRLWINQGARGFVDATSTALPADDDSCRAMVWFDVDGDRDLDLIAAAYYAPETSGGCGGAGSCGPDPRPERNRLYLNDGAGNFTDGTDGRLPADPRLTTNLALIDVDGDAELDLVFANLGASRVLRNHGHGGFHDLSAFAALRMPMKGPTSGSERTLSCALADVDGDGDLDAAIAMDAFRVLPGLGQDRLFLNDGHGNFADRTGTHLPVEARFSSALVFGDLDQDGDLDLVAGNGGSRSVPDVNRVFVNDGTGVFADAPGSLPLGQDRPTYALVCADLDGDGDLDLVFGNDGQNQLVLNDGSAVFVDATSTHMPAIDDATRGLVAVDVDGDGDLDLLVANQGQDQLLLNTGTGSFTTATATQLPVHSTPSLAVASGDVDGDGAPDLVFASDGQTRLYLNSGSGVFRDATAARLPVDADATRQVALADLDEDGDLDLVLANAMANRAYINDGAGTFTDATDRLLPPDAEDTGGLAVGDVDGDGDPDLLFAHSQLAPHRLLRNLLRQIENPRPAWPGTQCGVDAYARGTGALADFVSVFVSSAAASLPIPSLGTIQLDLQRAVALPPLLIAQPVGKASLSFAIPRIAAAAGISLHAQAVAFPAPFAPRLSNALPDLLLR